jgi:hypothetical protein
MRDSEDQFEIFRDPFRMLLQLIELVCESQGVEYDFNTVPFFENNTFVLRPSADADKESLPNFVFKKDQTEISWYLTLGRDIHCSKDLSRAEYNKMFVECMASLYNFD